MTPDPIAGSILDPQSLNRYSYVRNDPVNFIDPLGLAIVNCEKDYHHAGCGGSPPGWWGWPDNTHDPDPRCGVDPFCIANPPGPFASPVAQVQCGTYGGEYHCTVGSYRFASYVAGGRWVVDWEAQWKAQNQNAWDKFFAELEKNAAALSMALGVTVTPEALLAAQLGIGPDSKEAVILMFYKGGHWNFALPSQYSPPSCPHDRCGASPSLHVDRTRRGTFLHMDFFNPFSWYGLGAVLHLGADYILARLGIL